MRTWRAFAWASSRGQDAAAMRTLLCCGAGACLFRRLAATARCGGPWSSGLVVWCVTLLMKLAAGFCGGGAYSVTVVGAEPPVLRQAGAEPAQLEGMPVGCLPRWELGACETRVGDPVTRSQNQLNLEQPAGVAIVCCYRRQDGRGCPSGSCCCRHSVLEFWAPFLVWNVCGHCRDDPLGAP